MARGNPSTQTIGYDGAVVALTAAPADGDIVEGGTLLVVANGSGASVDVTLVNPNTQDGLAVANRVVAVAAGATKHIPVPSRMAQDVDALEGAGKVLVNYSAVTTVTRGVGKLSV